MTDEEKIKFARERIIGKITRGYIVGDLKRMLDIEVIPDHDGNVNFPIALYTLTSMSFLGYLIAERELLNDWERIDTYIEVMFNSEDKSEIEPHKEEFSNKYRNGLAHEFFPKMAGISRENNQLMTQSTEGYWVLDADILAKMFMKSTDNLVGASEDDVLCLRIFERYNTIQERNLEFKERPSTATTTSTARSSGATLPADPDSYTTRPEPVPQSAGGTGVELPNKT